MNGDTNYEVNCDMNCDNLKPFLDRIASRSKGADVSEDPSLRQHLSICPSCREAVRSMELWDSKLIQAMSDIAIPDGLSQRLIAALQQATAQQPSSIPPTAAHVRKSRVWSFTAMTAALVLIASMWYSWNWSRPPSLTAGDVATLLQQEPAAVPSTSQVIKRLPHGWTSISHLRSREWKQVEFSSHLITTAVVPFELRANGNPPCDGSLFVIPKSRWTPAPVTSVALSRVTYSLPHAWIVWSEDDAVFLLSLNGSPQLLEQLQRQLDASHSML